MPSTTIFVIDVLCYAMPRDAVVAVQCNAMDM